MFLIGVVLSSGVKLHRIILGAVSIFLIIILSLLCSCVSKQNLRKKKKVVQYHIQDLCQKTNSGLKQNILKCVCWVQEPSQTFGTQFNDIM